MLKWLKNIPFIPDATLDQTYGGYATINDFKNVLEGLIRVILVISVYIAKARTTLTILRHVLRDVSEHSRTVEMDQTKNI
jgi:hypothetical protein